MIHLHRMSRGHEPFVLNPDLIVSVEARPDTVIVLATGQHVLVDETPEEVVAAVRTWKGSIPRAEGLRLVSDQTVR